MAQKPVWKNSIIRSDTLYDLRSPFSSGLIIKSLTDFFHNFAVDLLTEISLFVLNVELCNPTQKLPDTTWMKLDQKIDQKQDQIRPKLDQSQTKFRPK